MNIIDALVSSLRKATYVGALFCLFSIPAHASTLPCFPFVGEQFKYSISWEFINAGTAEVKISQYGESGYRVDNFARTNGFLDIFKRVRATLVSEGLCIEDQMQSTLFTADHVEKKRSSHKRTEFLWQDNKVKHTKGETTTLFDVPARTLNILDAFYATRLHPPSKDQPLSISVFDSSDTYDVTIKLLKHDKLRDPWGKRVDCLVIQPILKTEGVFTSVGVIKIWLTNDAKRIPLKITAQLKIGRIIMRMKEYKKIQ